MPVLVRHVLGVRPDAADAGVVDDDVEAAEIASDVLERRIDLLPLGDVGRVRPRVDPERRELRSGFCAGLGVDAG